MAVTAETALTYSAFWAAVRVLAESVAGLPLFVYEDLGEKGRRRAVEDPRYVLLHDQPNPEMTSFLFRETLQAHLATWGNGYAEIIRRGDGRPTALYPLRPDRVTVRRSRETREIVYDVQPDDGAAVSLPAWNVLHVPGLAFDGLVGYSPVRQMMTAIGVGLAVEDFGAKWFKNYSRPSGVLEHPETLSKEARDHLLESHQADQSGENLHRVKILEEGMKWHEISIPPDEAQFIESRKFQVSEMARIFRIPAHLLGDLEKATFSNIEQQGIEFVVHCLRPWLVRWEQELRRKLFFDEPVFAEFQVDGLLRGDVLMRYGAYAMGRQWGWFSANDVRRLENLNPIPEGGDVYLSPQNMAPAGALPSAGAGSSARSLGALRPLIVDRCQHLVRKEVLALRGKVRPGDARTRETLAEYYAGHEAHAREILAPLMAALGRPDAAALAAAWSARGRAALESAADPAALLETWERDKAEAMAAEVLAAAGAMA